MCLKAFTSLFPEFVISLVATFDWNRTTITVGSDILKKTGFELMVSQQ